MAMSRHQRTESNKATPTTSSQVQQTNGEVETSILSGADVVLRQREALSIRSPSTNNTSTSANNNPSITVSTPASSDTTTPQNNSTMPQNTRTTSTSNSPVNDATDVDPPISPLPRLRRRFIIAPRPRTPPLRPSRVPAPPPAPEGYPFTCGPPSPKYKRGGDETVDKLDTPPDYYKKFEKNHPLNWGKK